ncbi:MAG: hypothetical protein ACPGXK_00110 [Phycisphaerae bacterium]
MVDASDVVKAEPYGVGKFTIFFNGHVAGVMECDDGHEFATAINVAIDAAKADGLEHGWRLGTDRGRLGGLRFAVLVARAGCSDVTERGTCERIADNIEYEAKKLEARRSH